MENNRKTYAFIDGVNLHLGLKTHHNWKISTKKLRTYLRDKYDISTAFYFISDDPRYKKLTIRLQKEGYVVVTRPSIKYKDHKTGKLLSKGNVDADLVLHAMIEFPHYDEAVIISGDGDFFGLLQHLKDTKKLKKILVPSSHRYSCLYNKIDESNKKYLSFLNERRNKLEV